MQALLRYNIITYLYKMASLITNGIKISAETFYLDGISKPLKNEFLFNYKIIIENLSSYTVKLLRREWKIQDGFGNLSVIEGKGVVGKQPVIEPNQTHQYISGCQLNTEIGFMSGSYTMEVIFNSKTIEVKIPKFRLITPFKLN